jgi:hypothetical protein
MAACAALAACNSSSINRGQAGESCTSHNDCAGSLGCYNGICAATAKGESLDSEVGSRLFSCERDQWACWPAGEGAAGAGLGTSARASFKMTA